MSIRKKWGESFVATEVPTKQQAWVSLNLDSLCHDQDNSNTPTTDRWQSGVDPRRSCYDRTFVGGQGQRLIYSEGDGSGRFTQPATFQKSSGRAPFVDVAIRVLARFCARASTSDAATAFLTSRDSINGTSALGEKLSEHQPGPNKQFFCFALPSRYGPLYLRFSKRSSGRH